MTTRMLINAQRAEQVRVAIIDGADLKDYQVQITDKNLCRGNIYRGIVANIQPSLGAAFVDIGEDRHGFLPVADVQPSAYHKKPPKDAKRPRIDQVLERGKPILVQVTKDGVGMKGAALSTNIALAGRYLVLTPFDGVRGISRKAVDDKTRKVIKRRLGKLNLPDGVGTIVRTNGLEQNQATLNRDLSALLRLWKRVKDEGNKGRGVRLLYSDQDLIVQALRDHLDPKIAQVIVDDDSVHEKAQNYMRAFMPRSKTQLIRYDERLPLFTRYNLEAQIDRIYERKAPLPSGGSIVIDGTEALTAIDVNSGRATQRGDHDESILEVNLEAAKEVARQLRLRDIGGLVVVDFIDMRTRKHQSKLEKKMRDAMKEDKARYTVGKISPNGLLEINRQRIKQALKQRTHRDCPTCYGTGTIASPEFAAAALFGRIEARVAPGMVEKATVAVHPEIADALQNHYRARLVALETELDLVIEVISAANFDRNEERIDYQQREKAIERKVAAPALTSSDLAIPAAQAPKFQDFDPDDDEEKAERKPRRRRRRRRKSKASKEAEANETPIDAEGVETSPEPDAPDEPDEETSKTARPRRRRRRRSRRSTKANSNGNETAAVKADPRESSSPDAPSAAAPPDNVFDWNSAFDTPDLPAPPTPTPEDFEEPAPKPKRSRRSPRTRKPKTAAQDTSSSPAAAPADRDAQPTHEDAWRSPLGAPQPEAEPPARRSPLRRDRSTLRWQWWGGPDDASDMKSHVDPVPSFKDSDEG